jgi:outer membrane receptor protein involved in Fe transport
VGRIAEDLRTPDGKLENTGFSAFNGEAAVSVRRERSDLGLRYAHHGGEYKLLEANGPPPGTPEGEEEGPERKSNDERVQLHGGLQRSEARYEAKLQWQRHSLTELSDEGGAATGGPKTEAVAFDLLLDTYSADLLMHHTRSEHFRGTLGFNSMFQTNDTKGPIALVPDATIASSGAFAFEEGTFGPWSVLGGLRFDLRHLEADTNSALGLSDDSRDYDELSGDAGVVYRLASHVALSANVGRSWRAPTLFELYANGPHLAEARYEVGDPTLESEHGLNVDGGIRWQSHRLRAELAGFWNQIDDFIFVQPTGNTVITPTDTLQVFVHSHSDAELTGGEVDAEFEATRLISLRGRTDFVRGTQKPSDVPLPLMAPTRVAAGIELHGDRASWGHAHIGLDYEHFFEQTRLNPLDVPTGAYDLVDIDAGFQPVLFGHRIGVDVSAHNVGNTKYKSFLSRYKTFAFDPGRNIVVRISTMM